MANLIKYKLGDITKIKTGKLDANASSPNGKYPFFTCSRDILNIDSYSYDCECVLVAGNGDLNVKYYNGKFDAYQRTYIIEDNSDGRLYMPYLYFFLELYIEELRKQSIGGVIKYIKLGNLTNAIIKLPSIEKQKNIVDILQKSRNIINNKDIQLQEYDQLIKSRFVEMFGDTVINEMGWEINLIKKLVSKEKNSLKAGPFGSSLKKEFYVEKGYKIYGQEQVILGDVNYGDYYIDEDRYKTLENCSIQYDDVLISLVGTYGELLIIPKEFEPGIINPRLMKITFNKDLVDTLYFKYFFKSESLKNRLSNLTHGGTMPILNLGIVKNIEMPTPPLELQKQFAMFVKQVDKLKFEVLKLLGELR